jgi:undecaprenyl-diphosphatase
MNIIQSIILGVVEGVTEFLPISSTAHLIITSKILNIPQTEFQKFFEVFIQSGAILAVIFLYISYILKHKDVAKKVMVSFLPTALIGFLLYKIIKNIFFESFNLIIFMILGIGFVFLIIEYLIKKKKISLTKNLIAISFTEALFIGLGQSLAVIPGVSRAGIVIIVMMILGYKRDQAALYSFLLAVPTILAASVFDFYKMKTILFSSGGNMLNLIVGFVVSFITAYIAVKWLIDFLKKNSLTLFGAYRILLAIILMILP